LGLKGFLKMPPQLKCDGVYAAKSGPTFAEIAKNKIRPAVIVEPQDHALDSLSTKNVVAENINPRESDLQISSVKNVKNGGVLVGCSSTEGNSRFKQIAESKLSKDFLVREVKGISPRVKIAKYSDDDLLDLVEHVIRVNINIFNTIYQAILQVDKKSYECLNKSGDLFVGYDYCAVFDALEVSRCFNCSALGRTSRTCTNKLACPRCGESHTIKDSKVVNLKCVNYLNLSAKAAEMDCGHAAWDSRCPVYINALDKLRSDILGA
jgi:hypothetical protein